MKWFILIIHNLVRNLRRTLLTLGAVMLALFLFTVLQTVLSALELTSVAGSGETRLAVIDQFGGPRNLLPDRYWSQLKRFEYVTGVVPMSFTLLSLPGDNRSYYVTLLIDPESYRTVFASTVANVPNDEYESFIRIRNGALVGQQIMRQYGWQVGQQITFRSSLNRVNLSLIICGVLTGGDRAGRQIETQILANRQYYNALIPETDKTVNIFWLRIDQPRHASSVAGAVSDYFREDAQPVSVQTESSMLARLSSYTQTIQLAIRIITVIVFVTILVVAANTIALSMRERKREIAIMKTLGYTPSSVLYLVLFESVVMSLIGGIAGIVLAALVLQYGTTTFSLGFTYQFVITPTIITESLVISVLLGASSGLIPAWLSSRINVIQAFSGT